MGRHDGTMRNRSRERGMRFTGEPEGSAARLSDSKGWTPSGCLVGSGMGRATPGAGGRRHRLPRRLWRHAAALFPILGVTLAMCLFGRAGVAHAQTSQVLVSNLGQPMLTAGGTEHGVAQGFRTGANTTGYTLTGIELRLLNSGSPTITLHRGSPTGSMVPGFTAGSATLEPNTEYWVVAAGGTFGWLWSVTGPDEDDTPAPGWSIVDRGKSVVPGSGWVDNDGDLAYQISVRGTIRPPPPPPPPPPPTSPDMVVDPPSVSDGSPVVGATFTLSVEVRNGGDAASSATTLRYYRSSDATIATSDTAVGTDAVVGLAAAATSNQSVELTAPAAGIYYYGACVDAVAGESDTTNNCSESLTVTVEEPTPDLVVLGRNVSDSSPEPGGTFRLIVTVHNQGERQSAATTMQYYRSTDATITTSDTSVGTAPVSALGASQGSARTVFLTAPSLAGTYYYGACVDAVAGESDTANNCSTSAQVDVSQPVPALPLRAQLLLALGLAAAGMRLVLRRRQPARFGSTQGSG